MEEKEGKRFVRKGKLDFPAYTLKVALELAKKVSDHGTSVKKETLSELLGIKGGAFGGRLTAARRYGLIEGTDEIRVSALTKKLLHPISQNEEKNLKIKTILSIPVFNKIYSQYGNNLPENKIFSNILIREYNVPQKSVDGAIRVLRQNLSDEPELSGIKGKTEYVTEETENIGSETQSSNEMKRDGKFTIQIISPFENYKKEITDDIDWKVIEAVIDGLKQKWKKLNLDKESAGDSVKK